jgi:hypothetical protein
LQAKIVEGCRRMAEPAELSDLIAYLTRTSRLTPSEALHVVGEVMSFLNDRPEEFICRRHRVLQAEGLPNTEIYARLRDELERWRFRAPDYTERQIRRLIYG